LALLWACFWTVFGLLSGIGEGYGLSGILFHTALPGLVFLIAAIVAWRWKVIGAILLLLEGLSTFMVYGFSRTTAVFLTLTFPPLLAGLLFLAAWRMARMPETRQDGAQHLPADSAAVAAFWRAWFALATVLAFRKTLCGGIGGR
jgi:hypothetical protein